MAPLYRTKRDWLELAIELLANELLADERETSFNDPSILNYFKRSSTSSRRPRLGLEASDCIYKATIGSISLPAANVLTLSTLLSVS